MVEAVGRRLHVQADGTHRWVGYERTEEERTSDDSFQPERISRRICVFLRRVRGEWDPKFTSVHVMFRRLI